MFTELKSRKINRPEGGITLGEAEKLYDINHNTFRRWVEAGFIPVIRKDKRRIFIDEKITGEVVKRYRQAPGRGFRTVYQVT